MGGCASKPKDLDVTSTTIPAEAPASPKKPELEAPEEKQNEAPLVDVSEPKKEENAEPTEAKVEDVVVPTAEPTESKVEEAAPAAADAEPKEEAGAEPPKAVDVVESPKVETPAEVKSDAPVVAAA